MKKKIIIGVILAIAIAFGIYKWKFSATVTTVNQTATVERGTLVVSISGSGQVSAANSASVTTTAGGVVKKVYVKNGDTVYSGQAIAEIDLDQDSRQKYSAALTSYESTKNALYSLQVTLFSTNRAFINDAVARGLTVDDPNYIQQHATWLAAEAAYKNNQNSLNSAWVTLRQASPIIYSPIAGEVVGLSLQDGSVLTGAQKIASIKTNALPTVTINLTEIDVPKVKIGNSATITLSAFADKTFTGKVVSVDTVGSVSSGVTVYPVVIKFDSANTDILSNMSAQANIITQTKTDVLLVPVGAVSHLASDVVTGISSDTQIEIVSGLAEGDTVITGTTTTGAASSSTKSVFSGNTFRVGGR